MKRYVIDAIRNGEAREELAAWQRRVGPQLYQHSVVIAEILVGARDRAAWQRWYERWVAPAERVGRIVTPGGSAWLRASEIVMKLTEAGLLGAGRMKGSFFNDCLLAASSREVGITIVTHNLEDFGLIEGVEPGMEFTPPFP